MLSKLDSQIILRLFDIVDYLIGKIMATQEELAAQLQASIDANSATAARLTEALSELSSLPTQLAHLQETNAAQTNAIAELQFQVDQLIANGNAVSPGLQAAVDAVAASNAAIATQAAALADIVPNAPVEPPVA